jgi:two-component system, NtrC family, sensor kinase
MQQAHILVVDDDSHIRFFLSNSVCRMGHKVTEAKNGEEALRILSDANTEPVHLLLTDVWMPGMSGVELLKAVREQYSDLPVVMISGAATLDSSLQAINMGAFAYLVKPFHVEEIREVIERGLRKFEESHRQHELESERESLHQRLMELETRLNDQPSPVAQGTLLSDLIEGLQHELGNLTTAIKLNLSVIEQRPDLPGDLRENIEDLTTSADELASLLNKFREYPRLNNLPDRIDLRAILHELTQNAKRQPNAANVQIISRMPGKAIPVRAKSSALERAFAHLIQNAIEAAGRNAANTPEGRGEVLIEAEIEEHEHLDRVHVRITDNGTGFDNSNTDEMFMPGYTTKIEEGFVRGLGFGLFIAKATMTLHGGRIHLGNRTEGGAEAVVELPIDAA